jgi:hypothetical protein
LVLSLAACRGDADFSDAAPTPVTLSAEDYEREIREIDRLVFEERPLGPDRRESLAAKLEELAKRVKASSDSRFIAIEALEIRRLAAGTRNLPSDAPRTSLHNEWMRIRNNLFDDRSWFARSAADLEPPPGGPTPGLP